VPTTISQRQLRNDSGSVMRRVSAGESFVVTSNGRPVADLVPHRGAPTAGPRRFVPVAQLADTAATLPDWGVEKFRAERADLDRHLDETDCDPWSR